MLRLAILLLSFAPPKSGPLEQAERERSHKLFVDVCTACHTLERIQGQAKTRDEWAGFIKGMVSEGAAVSDEEMDLLAGYLAEHYGDKR
jgi:mono/diheme cytochrome c family protein